MSQQLLGTNGEARESADLKSGFARIGLVLRTGEFGVPALSFFSLSSRYSWRCELVLLDEAGFSRRPSNASPSAVPKVLSTKTSRFCDPEAIS